MKNLKVYLILIAALTFSKFTFSQEKESVHTEVPSSPAFTILNFEPTSVMRPTSTSELKANVLGAFDENGKIVPNIGLEFAPYWFRSRDTLTYQQYLTPNVGQSFLQSSQISMAYAHDSISNGNKVGVGYRFQLMSGKPNEALLKKYQSAINELQLSSIIEGARPMVGAGLLSSRDEIMQSVRSNILMSGISDASVKSEAYYAHAKSISSNYEDNKESLLDFISASAEHFRKNDKAKQLMEYEAQDKGKYGWFVELGLGTSFYQIQNQKDDIGLDRFGFWGIVSYKFKKGGQLTGTVRYFDTNLDSTSTAIDAGLSFSKETSFGATISIEAAIRSYSLTYQDVNMDGESIIALKEDNTFRLAATATYNITPSIYVNLSIGKGFSDRIYSKSGFFSILGINYNLFPMPDVTRSE